MYIISLIAVKLLFLTQVHLSGYHGLLIAIEMFWVFMWLLLCSLDEEIIHISGSLAATGTGSVKWLEKRNVETQMLDR